MAFQRKQLKTLQRKLKEKRKFLQVIVGPRQVGKTTLVNQLLKENKTPHVFESADNITTGQTVWISQIWEIARIKLKTSGAKEFILAIDEIQKINDWSEVIKSEWDKDTRNGIFIKVILLGSSRLLIQKGLTESLAGRFEIMHLGHWSLQEMQDAFNISVNQFVWFGAFPGAVDLINDEKRWRDHLQNALIETTISKDILMMSRIDKPSLLKRLFELACNYSGQILSYNKMLGKLQDAGNTTTLAHYLTLLDTAGIVCGLEKYFIENVRQKGSSPKLQVYNTAYISAQSKYSFEEIQKQPEQWGRIVESAIGAHLINQRYSEDFKIYYWRHVNDEVDFVLEYKGKIIGLEIKSGFSKPTKGMQQFQKIFNPQKVLLIGKGGIHWEEFLMLNPVELF